MKTARLEDMAKGWFVETVEPILHGTNDVRLH